jgi:hypothetical protein
VEAPRITLRDSTPSTKFPDYMALMSNIIDSEPSSFQEAANQQVWQDAMVEGYTSIMKNDVWDIVLRLEGKSIVSSNWLHKIKHVSDGSIEKFKVKFVTRGFSQKEGVDYEETSVAVTMYTSIRVIVSLVSFMGWRTYQMDVKTTFLNGIIEKEVYMEQPRGFEINGKKSYVCKLNKALYGLKQALKAWYSKIDGYLQSRGFTKSKADPNLYYIFVGFDMLILVLYVDDLFLIGVENLIAGCKADMEVEFKMKDIGMMHHFLGLEVLQRPGDIFLG